MLENLKITHIINLTMEKGKFDNDDSELDIKYLNCPLWDTPIEPIQNYFEEGINFIDNALKDDNNKNRVLVHCRGGVSRSSTLIIAYLMKIHKMKYNEAYKYVQERRKIIEPNNGFVEQLKNFEKNEYVVIEKKKFQSEIRDARFRIPREHRK